jgi:S-(hydroxymethyl)glutathione dehydrogenase/alcohol dehydrogenase
MKAALLTAIGAPLEIADVEPEKLSYGQVLVGVHASGICGAQLQEIRGERGAHFPRLMGHEGCGVVVEAGPCVKGVKAGDRVVMHWRKGGGIECEPPRYRMDGRGFTGGQVVTFAEMAVCSENRLTRVPPETPVELCALLGCGLSTALGTIEREAGLRFGESILIIGCGGLGLNLILAAKLAQAARIVAEDNQPAKQPLALAMGAHEFRLSTAPEEDERFDCIIDTTGAPELLQWRLPLLAPSGRCVLVGQPKPRENITLLNARHFFDGNGKMLMATQGGGFEPSRDIPRYVAMHRAGLLSLAGLITHRLPLGQINAGLDLVRAGQAGRVLIEP